ncbi:MAG TPA: hypothetical protein VFS00_00575, partial [Polyangiaceae bacterium]|nr:hypothetical protein [Polyangiaceae bacterium]
GELRLRAAEPLLLALPAREKLRGYVLAWALARCGSEASVPALRALADDAGRAEATRAMAVEALLRVGGAAEAGRRREALRAELPAPVRAALEGGGGEAALRAALAAHLAAHPFAGHEAYLTLYRLDEEAGRPIVLEYARTAPLAPPAFKGLRRAFKLAESRADAAAFGALAYRFEKERPGPVALGRYVAGRDGRPTRITHDVMAGKAPPGAFGPATKAYLRRRAWRTLRRLGELGDESYVPMAVGALLPFTDADAVPERRSGQSSYGPFAPYLAFCHILYGGGGRLVPLRHGRAVRLRPPRAGGAAGREEAFPHLWTRKPEGLLHLLDESRCAPVHEFAARALEDCRAFCDGLDAETATMLLGRPYAPTARLGLRVARACLARGEGGPALWLAAARSVDADARAAARDWIDRGRDAVAGDVEFWAALASAPHADTRAFAGRLLTVLAFRGETAARLFERLLARLVALPEDDAELARDLGNAVVSTAAGGRLAPDLAALRALFEHPSAEVQRVGADLWAAAGRGLPPDETFLALLQSKHPGLRAAGLRLLGAAPDDEAAARVELWLGLATDKLGDLRDGSAPLLARLAAARPGFGAAAAGGLVEALLRRKLPEGAGPHVGALLWGGLRPHLDAVPDELLWRLVRSRSPQANDLAAALIEGGRLSLASLPVSELVDLADHDAVAIRRAAWARCEA